VSPVLRVRTRRAGGGRRRGRGSGRTGAVGLGLGLLLWLLVAGCTEPGRGGAGERDADAADAAADTDSEEALPAPFVFAVLADTHVIDDLYVPGSENGALDNETILTTRENLAAVRDAINGVWPAIELVLVAGDVFHNYPREQEDWSWYQEQHTRIDIAQELLAGFAMPVYPVPGNHDYAVPEISREFSHRLFQDKLGIAPYYAVEYRGFLFLACNSQLGETWNPESARYNTSLGSFGHEQLRWVEAQLDRGLPTVLFWHHPYMSFASEEEGGRDMLQLLKTHDNVVQSFAGHAHHWFDYRPLFGLPHLMLGSTRYDRNAMLIVEADPRDGTLRFLNGDCIDWEGSLYASPWVPGQPCSPP